MIEKFRFAATALTLLLLIAGVLSADSLDAGWASPPRDARLRAYWWWLNGCVTREAITRDLEQMQAKGFGGALICDADGSSQDGNELAPHGPTFLSDQWRELYRHALREADRLGLEMSLNIQSGWNLGGPMVSADDAAKKLVWSETPVSGPGKVEKALPQPGIRDGYYRDAMIVAFPLKSSDTTESVEATLTAISAQSDFPVQNLADGDSDTFWVSGGSKPGEGPSRERPAWIQIAFPSGATVNRLAVQPRPEYGPGECELLVSDDGKTFQSVAIFTADAAESTVVDFPAVTGRIFRLMVYGAFDRGSSSKPRNVQIRELQLAGPDTTWPNPASLRRPLRNWQLKAGHHPLHFSAPDTTPLLEEDEGFAGEEDTLLADVVDLTAHVDSRGILRWDVPAGSWQVLRFGYTIGNRSYVSTCSEGWDGYAIDVLDQGAFHRYWDAVVEPLIADAGPLAGSTLKYLHTDSWEVEPLNWTANMPSAFRMHRGYDLLPWAPVLAGRIVESREKSNRFLHDFRKTLGDLAIEQHYRPFRDAAHEHGLRIHPESGGPHAVPIDAQRCLGFNDVPMSEFWAWSWRHRVGDSNRFFVKQPASAAHTYGRKLVAAEGFTTIGPHWQETLWDNLKPSFDKACCEGLNLLVWHEFVCSPPEYGLPGIQYFAGTHLNPNVTWWAKSTPFFEYINRCQFMLQQGYFVADVCYYYGDHVPNFAQHKRTDPAGILPGYDYDVITEEAILTRASVQNGKIVLPDGMSYRLLVLRDRQAISLPLLRKLDALVSTGATVVGPKPRRATGLLGSDAEVRQLADAMWGGERVIDDRTARQVLETDGVIPDFAFSGGDTDTDLDYIHRRDGETDIYFVASRENRPESVQATFRVTGKLPELWNPVTGSRTVASEYHCTEQHTTIPLEFAPCGSCFVVFRQPINAQTSARPPRNSQEPECCEVTGPWRVTFDAKWGGPGTVEFPELISWTDHAEPGIKYYSGTAAYQTTFRLTDEFEQPVPGQRLLLDLGELRELAEVRVNGQSCGICWAPPFRVDISGAAQAGENKLVIEVVNFWPNRIIGDAGLPPEQRVTRTNIRKLTRDTVLMPSGLFGPVTLRIHEE